MFAAPSRCGSVSGYNDIDGLESHECAGLRELGNVPSL